jgi:hypothetical protein
VTLERSMLRAMSKKRTTLPKDFEALIDAGDLDRLKAVFEHCDVNARDGFYKHTALSFTNIPDELVRWLVARGTDVHAIDTWGRTALHFHASDWSGKLEVLCEVGCDVNAMARMSDGTPMHTAALAHIPKHVVTLLAHGARVDAQDDRGQMPLEVGLESCNNSELAAMAVVARLLVDGGAPKTSRAKAHLHQLGQRFEFHRSVMKAEFVEECRAALAELNSMFDTRPAPPRSMHDGNSDIVAKSATWQEQHRELWNMLVPSSGSATTVQGEVIRIAGRIADELERNGAVNWDDDYRRMARACLAHMQTGTPLASAQLAELSELVAALVQSAKGDTDRLAELAVAWVGNNPQPVPLASPDYKF